MEGTETILSDESLGALMQGTGGALPRRRVILEDDSHEISSEASTSALRHVSTTSAINLTDHHKSAISAQYESLNYQICENELLKKAERKPKYQVQLIRQSVNRWIICLFIGIITALIACMIDMLVYFGTYIKFELLLGKLMYLTAPRGLVFSVMLSWIGINCCFVAVACALVVYFAGPVAAGSGIPQIKCFLNGVMIPGVVRLKTLAAKAVGVAFSVCGGLCVGKEGPMIHSGAAVAAGISQGKCVTIPMDFHIFEYFRNDHDKRDFVSAGAAAGVAAAFGAPIGGVLFSLEEGASFWNQSLTWQMFFSAMTSSFTLSIVLSLFYGNAGLLSWSGLANFGTFENLDYNIWEMPVFVLVGAFGGLSGALFNHLNYKLTLYRNQFIIHRWQRFAEAMLVAATSATLAFCLVYSMDDCKSISGTEQSVRVQLWCPDGQVSSAAELMFRSPEESVKQLFHAPADQYSYTLLLLFSLMCWVLSMWTYGVSVPSGLFIPTLLTGAAWGRALGLAVQATFPDAPISLNPGKYALAGAAAQLGGVVRMTISLCAIIIEATRGIQFGLPIMVVLMTAKWVGDLYNEGLYDIHIHIAEIPLLGWDAPKPSLNIAAKQVMNSHVRAVEEVERVGDVYDLLCTDAHNGYVVVDRKHPRLGRLQGIILRSQLIVLLRKRVFYTDRADASSWVAGSLPVKLSDFTYTPRSSTYLSKLSVSEEDRDCWMDLRPYLNQSAHRVPLNATLSSMFKLFRGLGLRHIVVVDQDNQVEGIVTRKDVARFRETRRGFEYIVKEIYISR